MKYLNDTKKESKNKLKCLRNFFNYVQSEDILRNSSLKNPYIAYLITLYIPFLELGNPGEFLHILGDITEEDIKNIFSAISNSFYDKQKLAKEIEIFDQELSQWMKKSAQWNPYSHFMILLYNSLIFYEGEIPLCKQYTAEYSQLRSNFKAEGFQAIIKALFSNSYFISHNQAFLCDLGRKQILSLVLRGQEINKT